MARTHLVAATALALVGFVVAGEARGDTVRDAVEAGNRAFIAAFDKGDSATIASLYTEDAQVIAPGAPVASGRNEIAAFWQNSIDSGAKVVSLDTAAVESDGALACETGRAQLRTKDGATTRSRYIVVWKRVDGRWLLHRDIWNSQ